jgi:amino acid adenylation domain-containing protein
MQWGVLQREALRGTSDFTSRDTFASVAARITAFAAAAPAKPAIVDGHFSITFAELEHRSNQLATYMWERGAGPESCIALLMDRSAHFVIAALAILKTGAAYLPLDASIPADRASFILADAQAKFLLTHRKKSRNLNCGACRIIELDDADAPHIAARPPTAAPIRPHPSSLAYIIYTSGSTGQPKGVEITHANLCNLIDWHQAAFNVTSNDRASQVAGLGFDAAVWEIWPHLTAGVTLHFAAENTRRSAHALRDWIVSEKITISFVPTVLAEQLLLTDWPSSSVLRIFLTGADTLHRRPAAGHPFSLVNNYGPTECTVVATSGIVAPQSDDSSQPTIGRPIDNAAIFILDDNLRPVPAGLPGELCIAGALVGRGYRNSPAQTAEKFTQITSDPAAPPLRIYRTGDRAKLMDTGEIAFLGRLDDQVKIRGYRIELGEIIARLDRAPGVQGSAVIPIQSPAGDGPTLAAYIVPSPGARLTVENLHEFLAMKLPDYMIPAHFVTLAALPTTPNGKLDKSALPPPTPQNALPPKSFVVAPSGNTVQSRIAALVATLLEEPTIEPDENFFTIGGHSMLGVQLVARIRDMFGVKLTLRQLFGSPTVAALSAEVARLTEASK